MSVFVKLRKVQSSFAKFYENYRPLIFLMLTNFIITYIIEKNNKNIRLLTPHH